VLIFEPPLPGACSFFSFPHAVRLYYGSRTGRLKQWQVGPSVDGTLQLVYF
jgi:hypothetical protein